MSLQISIVPKLTPAAQPPVRPPLWFHLEDVASGAFLDDSGKPRLRTCATQGGCPAVFVLHEPRLKTEADMHWQFAMAGWNYEMTPEGVADELHFRLAFLNMTGLENENNQRRDYLRGRFLTARENPRFDKDRTCSRSVMTGKEGYSLTLALTDTVKAAVQTITRRQSFMAFRQSFRAVLTTNNVLIVTTMDGNQRPLLKPGKTYPQRVQDIDPDAYLYSPRTHRWLFFAANTVVSAPGGGSKVWPFPRGATYPWTGDGWRYTWFPHVSREEVRYPLSRLRKLAAGEPIPSPYRSN